MAAATGLARLRRQMHSAIQNGVTKATPPVKVKGEFSMIQPGPGLTGAPSNKWAK